MKIKILQQLFIRHNEIAPKRQSIWFFHGFADSGLAYQEVFDSPLNQEFNLYVVDLPGFGASPVNPEISSMKAQADLLSGIIQAETHGQGKVNIVAHSIGALIGTWICQSLEENIHCYFNVEGNLTEADSYFSCKPLNFPTAQEFAESFKEEIFELSKSEDRYKRYYSSLLLASPEGMRNWSLSSQEHINGNKCGFEFKDLDCKKVYLWGDVDTPRETQAFLQEHRIPKQLDQGVGHWHMIENSLEFYQDIHNTIKTIDNN